MDAEQDKRELEERVQMLEEELARAHQGRVSGERDCWTVTCVTIAEDSTVYKLVHK